MNEIVGCGIDIEELDRFKKFIPTHPDLSELTKLVYSDYEIRINRNILPHVTFPLAFSCKEAFFKAFGVSWTNSPISWKDIELIFSESGNLNLYEVNLSGYARILYERLNCSGFKTEMDYNAKFVTFQVILFSEIRNEQHRHHLSGVRQ